MFISISSYAGNSCSVISSGDTSSDDTLSATFCPVDTESRDTLSAEVPAVLPLSLDAEPFFRGPKPIISEYSGFRSSIGPITQSLDHISLGPPDMFKKI